MKDVMHRFFRAARGAGVHLSAAESIDAMRAVAAVGFEDREILRDALLTTIAKTQDEKQSLAACFDLFFAHPDIQSPAENDNARGDDDAEGDEAANAAQANDAQNAPPSEAGQQEQSQQELGPLAQLLLSQDRSAMQSAIASASSAADLSEIRYFTQRGIYSSKILDLLGIQRLRDDLERLTANSPGDAERLAVATEALRETVREAVSQALLLYGREEAENLRKEILQTTPMARLERRQIEQMRALIRQIARRLRERYSKPRKRQRRGHLDVRRTIRRNAAWGGIPFLTSWKRKRRDRPRIVAICDVSGSVAQVSDFFLLLIHSLHEVVSDVRSFAFSGNLVEVSHLLDKLPPEEAMKQIMQTVGFGSSDYGRSFEDFEKGWMKIITPRTTVIVLGDARSNNLDPRADILRSIGERAKRVVWLNPEGRVAWGFGDSEMPRYATFCNVVRQCSTARQLERAVTDIVASYN
jgi:uncharacterized protein with von Willebrand factor type A (vWA) domain